MKLLACSAYIVVVVSLFNLSYAFDQVNESPTSASFSEMST